MIEIWNRGGFREVDKRRGLGRRRRTLWRPVCNYESTVAEGQCDPRNSFRWTCTFCISAGPCVVLINIAQIPIIIIFILFYFFNHLVHLSLASLLISSNLSTCNFWGLDGFIFSSCSSHLDKHETKWTRSLEVSQERHKENYDSAPGRTLDHLSSNTRGWLWWLCVNVFVTVLWDMLSSAKTYSN